MSRKPSLSIIVLLSILSLLLITSCPSGKSNGNDAPDRKVGSANPQPEVVIFAGSLLKPPLERALNEFHKKSKVQVDIKYGSSNELAKLILSGSRCDIFIPDRHGAIDKLAESKLITESNVKPLFLERLAVIVKRGEDAPAVFEGQNVIEFLKTVKKIAIVDPTSAYSFSGVCAMQAINRLNPTISDDAIVRLPDTKAVFLYVEKGTVDLAVVFNSEYAQREDVSLVGYIPQDSFNPYPYPLVVLPNAISQTEIVARILTDEEMDIVYNEQGYQSKKGYVTELTEGDSVKTKDQKAT